MEKDLQDLQGPIAVFGAGGFIGANLVRSILKHRSDCFAITQQSFIPWRLHGLNPQNIVRANIISMPEVEGIFSSYQFKTIFNFSAYGAYSRQNDSRKVYETNLIGLLNLINAAERQGFKALVHAGSSSEYGLNCSGPGESDRLDPNSHYAVSKAACAYLIQYLGIQKSLPLINLRVYSAYGPLEESDRLVPNLITHGMEGKLPPLVNPEISRDFIYVDDVVEASIRAAKLASENSGQSFNIGTGTPVKIKEIVEVVRDQFGIQHAPQWGSMPNRHWDLQDWYANPEKANQRLGWKAKTSLREGLLQTKNWAQANGFAPRIVPKVAVSRSVRITAVVACYKDAQAIPIMHQRLAQAFSKIGVDYEIIFVNDASPDQSDDVLRNICAQDSRVIAIEHSRNFGSQSAFLDGMAVSSGDAVVLLDGDLQDPPELIPEFYKKWREGFEVVYGSRIRRETGVVLQVCYKLFYRLFRSMSYVRIPVDAGDFSLIDRKVVNQMLKFSETDQFLRGLRAWVGFKQTGVEYVRPERMFGVSTNNWWKNFWWARKAIFNFSFAPLEAMLICGMGLTGLSLIAIIAQIVIKLTRPEMPHGIATIITLVLFFGGLNLLGLSILGEYVGKVFEEAKDRPKFIRRKIRFADKSLASEEEIQEFMKGRTLQTV